MKHCIIPGAFLAIIVAMVTACGGGTASTGSSHPATPVSSSARQVQVTMTNSKITSSRTTFMADTPYDFVVTNKGTAPHDFIIQTRPKEAAVGGQANQGVLYLVNSTRLHPGATVRFTYAFPQSTSQSDVRFIEHLAGSNEAAGPLIPVQVKRG